MMKTRFLAVIIAVMMIVGAAVTVSAFNDVEEGYEHAAAISTLTQLGVINGYEDGSFKPEANVERDEMAKLVYVLYTTFEDAGNGAVKFNDVAADNWANGYISWCSAKNIVGGYGDGNFKPDNNVTYDEALKMVCATLGYTDFDSTLWPTDVRQKALRDLDLGADIDAKGSDYLTRGEVAQLLYNALFVDMNETKIDYVYDTSYVDGNGDPVKVKVPVEVAKTLAEDVWAFTSEVVRVVATENYAYNALAAKTGKDDEIKVQDAAGVIESIKLEDLGLEAYEEKTDALIGLDIMTVEKDGKLVANASVLGCVKVAEVLFAGRDDADAAIIDEVKIDGVLYADAKNSDTLFDNLQVLTYGAGTVTVDGDFTITVDADDVADIEYPHMAIVMDSEGDGIVDAIAIDYYKLATVTKVEEVKATKTADAYTKYTVSEDLANGTSAFVVKSTDIADAKALVKGDVFVYATIDGIYFIDEVIAPVKEAVTKITTGKNAAITLAETGAVKYIDGASYFKNSGYAVAFNAAELLKGDAEAQDYYIYNGVVVFATSIEEVADSYNLALLMYTKAVTEPEYNPETKKLETKWPAVLLIDGKEVTVDLKSIDGQTSTDDYLFGGNTTANGTPILNYTLVNYVVDEDTGKYVLTTTAADLGDTVIVEAGATIKLNANTGLYTITDTNGTKVFELSDASAIYYTFENEDDADDDYIYFGTYTAANILKKFESKATAQIAYLLKNEDNTYTLLATVIDGELVAPVEAQTRTYKNDARLIKYVAEGSTAEAVDGVGYYTYLFLDFATMKNGTQTIDTTLSIEKGATKAVAGNFYGWDETAKKYVKVTATDVDCVEIGTITGIDAARGIIYIDGVQIAVGTEVVDFAEGYKLPADINIFSNAKNNVYEYATFDVASLAELFEAAKDESKTLDAAVGYYYDEDGNLGFAWIMVDNYYYATSGDAEVFTQASDIVGRIQ